MQFRANRIINNLDAYDIWQNGTHGTFFFCNKSSTAPKSSPLTVLLLFVDDALNSFVCTCDLCEEKLKGSTEPQLCGTLTYI